MIKKTLLCIVCSLSLCAQAQTKKELQKQIADLKNENTLLFQQLRDKDSSIKIALTLLTETSDLFATKQQQIISVCKTVEDINKKKYLTGSHTSPPVKSTNITEPVSNSNSGRTIYTGSRGGRYYINSKGNKTYIKK